MRVGMTEGLVSILTSDERKHCTCEAEHQKFVLPEKIRPSLTRQSDCHATLPAVRPIKRRSPSPATLIGDGQARELAAETTALDVDVVVFATDLTREYVLAARIASLSLAELERIATASLEAACPLPAARPERDWPGRD